MGLIYSRKNYDYLTIESINKYQDIEHILLKTSLNFTILNLNFF